MILVALLGGAIVALAYSALHASFGVTAFDFMAGGWIVCVLAGWTIKRWVDRA